MNMSVDQALHVLEGFKVLQQRLRVLHDLGLGYLTLGEETPGAVRWRSAAVKACQ
jgi:excinuclease ABC subunit A